MRPVATDSLMGRLDLAAEHRPDRPGPTVGATVVGMVTADAAIGSE